MAVWLADRAPARLARKLAILLLDHVPRKVIAPSHELLGLADVMAAWVERSIRVRGLSAEAARDLRAAMPELAREFRHALDEASAHRAADAVAAEGGT